jgi:uncharacterized membrane protein YphA (DoxX/SURF4 family)
LRSPYSTFPGRWQGLGLLLLRSAVGVTLIIQSASALVDSQGMTVGAWAGCLIELASGISLLIGFVTPAAAIFAVLVHVGIGLSWFPVPAQVFFNSGPLTADLVITTMACAFLGPGAFSLDARLFGRRKIIIPRSSGLPKA